MGIRVGDYGTTVAQAAPVRFGVYIGAIATAIAIGIAASQGGGGGPPPSMLRYPNLVGGSYTVSSANVWLAPNGSDSGANCIFSASPVPAPSPTTTACLTFNKAITIAQAGGGGPYTVGVVTGNYGIQPTVSFGADLYQSTGSSTPVNFECQTGAAAGSVTFSDPSLFAYGVTNVTFTGSCFNFHVFQIGSYGSPPTVSVCGQTTVGQQSSGPMTFNGVLLQSLDFAASCDVTVENSQVGPIVACFATGQNGGFAECPTTGPLSSVTSFWASVNPSGGCHSGTASVQAEPYIHSAGSSPQFLSTGTVLNNDLFYGMNSMATSGSGGCGALHQGGLLVWGSDGTVIENSEWLNNTIYDIEYNAGTTEKNQTVQNTIFAPPVNSNESYPSTLTPPNLPNAQCQEGLGNISGQTFTNVLYRYDTFAICENVGNAGSTFTNVRFVGNLVGAVANCTAVTGISYASNVVGNAGSACSSGGTISGDPFNGFSSNDFSLGVSTSPPAQYVTGCTSAGTDPYLTSDYAGNPRPKTGSSCDAGAYENK